MHRNRATPYDTESDLCPTCGVMVKRHNMARHKKSPTHIARLGVLPSDIEFTAFVQSVSRDSLSVYERILYDRLKEQHA
jgi:hypothetical protein